MNCERCGNYYQNCDNYCIACGHKLYKDDKNEQEKTSKKYNYIGRMIVIIGILAFVGICIIVTSSLTNGDITTSIFDINTAKASINVLENDLLGCKQNVIEEKLGAPISSIEFTSDHNVVGAFNEQGIFTVHYFEGYAHEITWTLTSETELIQSKKEILSIMAQVGETKYGEDFSYGIVANVQTYKWSFWDDFAGKDVAEVVMEYDLGNDVLRLTWVSQA